METITFRGCLFEVCVCGTCGATFFIHQTVRAEQRRIGGYSYCPNGHRWGYSEANSEERRIRRERDSLRQQIAERDDCLRDVTSQRDTLEKRLRAHVNRVSAGVCPCCHRTFKQLALHMKNKHPALISSVIQNNG